MAYLFLDDGGPEASDYSNNYFQFNESDTHVLNRLIHVLNGKNPADPEIRSLVESICKSSYSDNINGNLMPCLLIGWIKNALEKINWFLSMITRPKLTLG